jgi:hypothetical protein
MLKYFVFAALEKRITKEEKIIFGRRTAKTQGQVSPWGKIRVIVSLSKEAAQ